TPESRDDCRGELLGLEIAPSKCCSELVRVARQSCSGGLGEGGVWAQHPGKSRRLARPRLLALSHSTPCRERQFVRLGTPAGIVWPLNCNLSEVNRLIFLVERSPSEQSREVAS